MSRRLIVRAEAEADLINAAEWYDNREAGMGLELLLEVPTPKVFANLSPGFF